MRTVLFISGCLFFSLASSGLSASEVQGAESAKKFLTETYSLPLSGLFETSYKVESYKYKKDQEGLFSEDGLAYVQETSVSFSRDRALVASGIYTRQVGFEEPVLTRTSFWDSNSSHFQDSARGRSSPVSRRAGFYYPEPLFENSEGEQIPEIFNARASRFEGRGFDWNSFFESAELKSYFRLEDGSGIHSAVFIGGSNRSLEVEIRFVPEAEYPLSEIEIRKFNQSASKEPERSIVAVYLYEFFPEDWISLGDQKTFALPTSMHLTLQKFVESEIQQKARMEFYRDVDATAYSADIDIEVSAPFEIK